MINVYDKNGKVSSSRLSQLTRNDEQQIHDATANWPTECDLIERLYAIKNKLATPPKCQCGDKLRFSRGHYLQTCGSKKCAAIFNRPYDKISCGMKLRVDECKEYVTKLYQFNRWNRYSIDECFEYYEMNCIGSRWTFEIIHADFICNLWFYLQTSDNFNIRQLIKELKRCTKI